VGGDGALRNGEAIDPTHARVGFDPKPLSSIYPLPSSLERRQLELDLGELVGGLADLAQEGQPAWVGVDFLEQVVRCDVAESRVLVRDRFVEPRERLVGIAAECVDLGDVVRPVLLVFRDQRIERGMGVRFAPQRAVNHRQTDHPVAMSNFSSGDSAWHRYLLGPICSLPARSCWNPGSLRIGSQTGSIFNRSIEMQTPAGIESNRRRIFTDSPDWPARA
jgi:hypothetical protein